MTCLPVRTGVIAGHVQVSLVQDLCDHIDWHLQAGHFRGEAVSDEMAGQVDTSALRVEDRLMEQESKGGVQNLLP